MNQDLQSRLQSLQQSVSMAEGLTVLQLIIYLTLGGVLSLYLRWLYGKFGVSASNAQAITRVFPLLTIVTTAVMSERLNGRCWTK